MNSIHRFLYCIFGGLALVKSGYSAPTTDALDAITAVKNNSQKFYTNTNKQDAIANLSAAFQIKAGSLQTGCILKGGAKLCLNSDELSTIPSSYTQSDTMALPAFVDVVVYSEPYFSGTATTLASSSVASKVDITGLKLGSIKQRRKACVYYNASYTGMTVCDYLGSGSREEAPIGIKSLHVASGSWIDVFQNKDHSGLHMPFSKAMSNIMGTAYFPSRALSYTIHSQNEPVNLVSVNPATGYLTYEPFSDGGQIMDFSSAGYMGGGVPRPTVLPVITLSPPQDPTADAALVIQEAINQQAQQPLINGFRNGGSIFLSAGTWNMLSSLTINTSGIVLQGDPNGGTVLVAKGSPRTLINIGATSSDRADSKRYPITDTYLGLGAKNINVDNTSGLNPGDQITIQVPVSAEWIALLGMDKLVRDGVPQVWLSVGNIISIDRIITSVDSNTQITIDASLPQPIDANYTKSQGGAYIRKYSKSVRINQVALEHIEAVGQFINEPISSKLWVFAVMNHITDSWMEDIKVIDFGAGAITCNKRSQRITLNNLSIERSNLQPNTAGWAADIILSGSQILIRNASMSGPELSSSSSLNYYFLTTGSTVEGPNVVLNMTQTKGNRGTIQPHMRWSAGLLVDNAVLPYGQVEFMNRGNYGSGHGWTIGYGVIWNAITNSFHNQSPPGSNNWAVGVLGKPSPKYFNGNWGTSVHLGKLYDEVPSLYLYQLSDRLGLDALRW